MGEVEQEATVGQFWTVKLCGHDQERFCSKGRDSENSISVRS